MCLIQTFIAETTSILAANIVHELLSMVVAHGPSKGFKSPLLTRKAMPRQKDEL